MLGVGRGLRVQQVGHDALRGVRPDTVSPERCQRLVRGLAALRDGTSRRSPTARRPSVQLTEDVVVPDQNDETGEHRLLDRLAEVRSRTNPKKYVPDTHVTDTRWRLHVLRPHEVDVMAVDVMAPVEYPAMSVDRAK